MMSPCTPMLMLTLDVAELLAPWPWLLALFIVVARIMDVALGTLRTICVVRGYRVTAAVLGFFEVLVWVLAVAGVLKEVTWLTLLAYGVGFSLGNVVGVWLEEKLAMGSQLLMLISRQRSHTVAFGLRMADVPVTEVPGEGRDGPVSIALVVVSRRRTQRVLDLAQQLDADVRITIQDVRSTALTRTLGIPFNPTGWRAIFKKK